VTGGIAAILLFWGLGHPYLWQDEAATAVLAERMLRFGRPLAYDGKNLVGIDLLAAEDPESVGKRTTGAREAIDYYVSRGDFRADTAWTYHPWGQFVVAAIGLEMLGHGTLAARALFALAALLSVLLLYDLIRRLVRHEGMATLAAAMLALNAYWILHGRQCRYYPLSSLFLLLALGAYWRWQRGRRLGAATFVAASWCWFQIDYGTFWPVCAVLFLDAILARPRAGWRTAGVGLALAASVAPFVSYYQLWGRRSFQVGSWAERFRDNFVNLDLYVVSALVLTAAAGLLAWRWRRLPPVERRLVAICCAILAALALWVPSVASASFLRYVVVAAPLGCLVAAWVLVRGTGRRGTILAWLGAAVLVLTPWASLPVRIGFPAAETGPFTLIRPELPALLDRVFGHPPDPNRIVIDWLASHAAPDDEILINYEDVPLMFYLPNPIRGGIAAFRVEDHTRSPQFAIMRRSVSVVYPQIFNRELGRYRWIKVPLHAPDVPWGNNPDPKAIRIDARTAPDLLIARRAP
jgi:hypothetical protein